MPDGMVPYADHMVFTSAEDDEECRANVSHAIGKINS